MRSNSSANKPEPTLRSPFRRHCVDFYYLQDGSWVTHRLHRGTAQERAASSPAAAYRSSPPNVRSCNRQNGPSARKSYHWLLRWASAHSRPPGPETSNSSTETTCPCRKSPQTGGTRDEVDFPLRGGVQETRLDRNHWTTVANRRPPPPRRSDQWLAEGGGCYCCNHSQRQKT